MYYNHLLHPPIDGFRETHSAGTFHSEGAVCPANLLQRFRAWRLSDRYNAWKKNNAQGDLYNARLKPFTHEATVVR
jgi:hypothetical protein